MLVCIVIYTSTQVTCTSSHLYILWQEVPQINDPLDKIFFSFCLFKKNHLNQGFPNLLSGGPENVLGTKK